MSDTKPCKCHCHHTAQYIGQPGYGNQPNWAECPLRCEQSCIHCAPPVVSGDKVIDEKFLEDVKVRHNTDYPPEYWKSGGNQEANSVICKTCGVLVRATAQAIMDHTCTSSSGTEDQSVGADKMISSVASENTTVKNSVKEWVCQNCGAHDVGSKEDLLKRGHDCKEPNSPVENFLSGKLLED